MKKSARIVLALLSFSALCAAAQNFPARSINLIVPFAAGGPSDALARVIAQSMSATLGQQVVIENVTGAGGTLAAAKGAAARPDGYTLLLSHIGQSASVTLYRKLPYDPVGAFDSIGLIAEVPMVIVGRKDLPPKDIGELIAYIKANKNKVTYGNGGVGSASHFCGLLFMSALQAEMTTVSYRGSGPAMLDVLGGRLDLLCDQTTTTTAHLRAGTIKGYAVTMKARVPAAPELPTLAEAGMRDFDLSVWYGLVVPKGTPKPIVDQLAAALRAALVDATVVKRLAEFGAQPVSADRASPEGAAAFFRGDVAKWAPVIKAAGVYAD
ncbi:MAG: tripartite tricarboxylate transporter substrate-binding protein [Burkholderiales bacterium]